MSGLEAESGGYGGPAASFGQVDEGMGCCLTRCPEFQCSDVVTENFFQALVPAEKMATYHRCVRIPCLRPATVLFSDFPRARGLVQSQTCSTRDSRSTDREMTGSMAVIVDSIIMSDREGWGQEACS